MDQIRLEERLRDEWSGSVQFKEHGSQRIIDGARPCKANKILNYVDPKLDRRIKGKERVKGVSVRLGCECITRQQGLWSLHSGARIIQVEE